MKFSTDARVHPVFHVSLLEPADPETPLQEIFYFQPDEGQEYFVERILDCRKGKYLVKWEGYGNEENIWESKKNLKDYQQLVRKYHADERRTRRDFSRGAGRGE